MAIKLLPYRQQTSCYPMQKLAGEFRQMFKPLLKKRLPDLYYSGWQHNYVIDKVAACKKNNPYFIKPDIEKFYPSVPLTMVLADLQLAYKMLLGLKTVPNRFATSVIPAICSKPAKSLLFPKSISTQQLHN